MKKYIKQIILTFCIMAIIPISPARGTIASLVLTPANPTTLSNGLSYYLAGLTYNFTVQIIDPDITGWGELTNVQITIPNSTNIVLHIDPSGTGVNLPVTITSGTVNAVADVAGTYNNCIVTFKVTIRWDSEESVYAAGRPIDVLGETTNPALNTLTETVLVSYGINSTIKILSFAQDGVASDGMVNPYHDPFAVTGVTVYNVPGATTLDAIELRDLGEILDTILYLNGVPTVFTDNILGDDLTYNVTTGIVNTFGANVWRIRAIMSTAGGPESSQNTLSINCDEVQITNMIFVNGGGIDAPAYYRSVNIPGTEVIVTARMRNSLSAMVGNTTVRIRNYTENLPAQDIYVLIPNGSFTGTAFVTNPVTVGVGLPANPGTLQNDYRAEIIEGGAYGGDDTSLPLPVYGQSDFSRISQPGAISINWDNGYYPWASSTPFTIWGGVSATAYSITFNWTALVSNYPNADFYSYRVYYKDASAALFQLIDRNTLGYAALANSATATVTILGLQPLTNYDYYITAVDVFGQEIPLIKSLPAGVVAQVGTLASTIRVEISDGITNYNDNTFTMPPALDNPPDRALRKTAINVKAFIVAAGDLPDIVNIIVADNATGPLIDAFGDIFPALLLLENTPAGFYRIPTLKTGTNEWSGYIPDTNPLITVGTNVKFIVETIKNGVRSYADNNSETETPVTADPNDYPYTFTLNMQPKFTPWPTRVLNNVITAKNPTAYPSYYLTDDAYVSIVVYDIKGRPVKTILDKSFRKGGENIKDGGWSGDNKSRRKVGIGLYYMHFKANRASDGKVIIDSFQKVVMAY